MDTIKPDPDDLKAALERMPEYDDSMQGIRQWFERNHDTIRAALQSPAVPEGWKLVPIEPEEHQWDGLARSIIMGRDLSFDSAKRMRQHLLDSGYEITNWLDEELSPDSKHLSKGDICVLVYKAMISAAPEHESGV